ncbi:hypothetical protein SCLCIDRAFT_162607 [Scleroderma citrinum Foug A]|uniref:Glucose receptor Git3 N-terminal domain-containing protein n=1 Tax=Scleroderma citrinum Foug A TaxID=1036808 RepID=A0A0C3ERD7_9AGAM|nr:hypothetical protein SCLCIDRAFT_162607 [Scleroderma citrinum Foug A]
MICSCEIFLPAEVWPTWVIVSAVQVMLQIRLYALYNRSKKILAFLAICFLAEAGVMLRIYINYSSTIKVTNQPLPGAYFCGSTSYGRWISYSVYPTLAFESILCCTCMWVGYQRSKEYFSSPGLRWSRAHLIDILIGGNVLYFLGFSLTWAAGTVTLLVAGFQWGQAVNIFGAATSIIGGCHLILHLREATSPVSHSTYQLSTGAMFVYQSTTAVSEA